MNYKLSRVLYNFKRYGFFKTIKKVISRILKLDKKNNVSQIELYRKWILENEPSFDELSKQRNFKFNYNPKISIVVPMFNTNEKHFLELYNSILDQTYSNWELCLADGSAIKNENIVACFTNSNKVKYEFLDDNNGISGNTNAAIKMATGDYIAFLDHDDVLPNFALFEVVRKLNEDRNLDFIYSDEDKIDENGNRFDPYFKPDFSPQTIECHNYITHLVVVKKALVDNIGMLNSKVDGAQDFDFVLRVTENTKKIAHIPKILYHWRAGKNSTANSVETKIYAYEAGKRVVEEHLNRIGVDGVVEDSKEVPGIYKIKFMVKGNPKVTILIPNKDNINLLKKCLKSILKLTTYENYEIFIIENNSEEKSTFDFYKKIEKNPKIKVLQYPEKGFNYSKIINFGVMNSKADYILQLNNDTKILTSDWLELFIGYASQREIGAVGARLYFADKSIQHAGIAYGIGGIAGNLLVNLPYGVHGYYGREALTSNVSAVTGACLFARREIYDIVRINGRKII